MRLLLTGGGTGGHIYPLLSILEELKNKLKEERLEVLYVGSRSGVEQEIIKNRNIPSFFIYSGKWRRYWLKWLPAALLNFRDLFLILIGFFQAFFIVTRYRPEIIIAKGGYVALPIVFAAWFCHIPVVTHESDIVMGFSNRMSAKIAKKIFVSFPLKYYKGLPKDKLLFTGNPVRQEFYQNQKSKAHKSKNLPTILITGGSQGSRKINETVYKILPRLLQISKVYHSIGNSGFTGAENTKNALKEFQDRYFIYDFLEEEMPKIMQNCDLVVSRAGANTLAEISASSKPSILIPLKNAASDHQAKNAHIFEQNEAAVIIFEDNLTGETLIKNIKKLISNKDNLKKMGERASKVFHHNAASLIAEEILKIRQ